MSLFGASLRSGSCNKQKSYQMIHFCSLQALIIVRLEFQICFVSLFCSCRQCISAGLHNCSRSVALFPFTHRLGVRLTAWDTYLEAASYPTFDSPSGWHRLGSWCLTTSEDWRGFQEVTPCQAARPATTCLHVIRYKGQRSWYFCVYVSVSSDVCKDFKSSFGLLLYLVT